MSTDDDTTYHSVARPGKAKHVYSPPSSVPPALPKKPPNFPFPAHPFTYDSGSNLIEDIDSSNANGAILIDASHGLASAFPSDSRFT